MSGKKALTATAEAYINFMKTSKTFDSVMKKVKILHAGDGKCQAELKVEEEHVNVLGGLHGGLSSTLVDCLTGVALTTTVEYPHVSVDLHLSFLKGAKLGDDILIDSEVIKQGKTMSFLHCEIKNKLTGDMLVRASHTKFIMRP